MSLTIRAPRARTVRFVLTDGDGGTSAAATNTINVTAVNDAPVLDNTGTMSFGTITEEGSVNSWVSTLIATAGGDRITDVDAGAVEGIAITSVNNGNGTWRYSTDGGSTWFNVGAVSNTSALLLRANDYISYVGNGQNGGTADFAFRAWDQTSGTQGTKVDVSSNGGTTAFSTATETASITSTDVNDAPFMPGVALGSTTEDTPYTRQVSWLAGFSSDVDTGAQKGLAIVGVDDTNGIWQYTLDGTNWFNIGNVTTSNALLLASDATSAFRFVPNANWNGTTGAFSYKAWDQTSGTAGDYVDASVSGGTTAFSGTSGSALTVTAANDAPTIANWYNAGWAYRKAITIDHTKVAGGADLSDFPVLINLGSDAQLAAGAQADGDDILLTSADGTTKLDHEIETYVTASGEFMAWVRVPTLSASLDTVLYLYYGNAGAANQENSGGVWDSDYQGVWHLDEMGDGTSEEYKDATSNVNNGTLGGTVLVASFDMTASANSYRYEDLTSVTDYVIQSGDYLEYDVYYTSSTDQIAFDYTTTDGSYLRNTGSVDQNGINARPGEDLSAYALDQWYHRTIALPAGHVGKTISYYDIASEINTTTTQTAYFDNIRITDGAGNIQKTIYASGDSFTHAAHLSVNGAINSFANTSTPPAFINTGKDGKVGSGQQFDGTDDYISTTTSIDDNLGSGFTVGQWIYSTNYNYAGWMGLVSNVDGDNADISLRDGFQVVVGNRDIGVYINDSGGNNYIGRITTGDDLSDGNWHYVVATWSGALSSSGFKIYIDGTATDDADYNAGTVDSFDQSSQALEIGRWVLFSGPGRWFDGKMDEVRVSSGVRSADWIATEYANQDSPGTFLSLSAQQTAPVTLTGTDENTTSSGTAVSAILNTIGAADVDIGALSGMAVTGKTGNGTWQYSTDGGTWANFGSVSGTSALLLTSTTQVRYTPDGQNGETATFTFRAWDQTTGTASSNGTPSYANPGAGGGTTAYSSQTATASMTITAVNDAPAITLPGSAVDYTEGDGAVVIDATATVSDVDSADFDGGTLTVDFTANGTDNDRLAIRDEGPGVGNIAIAGAAVTYDSGSGPVVIGTFAGGTNGSTPLVITLNADADATAVHALARNITYQNVANDPSTLARTVRFVLTDGDGGTSNAVTKTVNLFGDHTLYVTTTSDAADGITTSIDALLANRGADGQISLREAILAMNNTANSGSPDQIFFSIGSGTQTINVTSALPSITDAVIVDASTQPGFVAAPIIELNGSGAGVGANGLRLNAGSDGSTIRGFVINRFDVNGIDINASNGNAIEGNFIGADVSGTSDLGNADKGIRIANGAANNIIGGTTAAARNLISGNDGDGIRITVGSVNNQVLGNYIGTDLTGTVDLGNTGYGVLINSAAVSNTIGGSTAGAGNLISGNDTKGVGISGAGTDGNVVQGNYVGTDVTGTIDLGNTGTGVWLANAAAGNTIGGTAAGAGNLVAFSGAHGIDILDTAGANNSLRGNRVHSSAGLGIDLNNDDLPTANDAGDADSGPNNLQNYPVLTSANTDGSGVVFVSGRIESAPTATYYIDFFANSTVDPSGHGEGETYLGEALVVTDASGIGYFSGVYAATVPVGDWISATATDASGNSSEFSLNIQADDMSTLTVDTTSDTVDGNTTSISLLLANRGTDNRISLREAIEATNNTTNGGSPDEIRFDIAGAGPHTINVLSALPTITDAVVIDGTTEPDFGTNPVIEINGQSAFLANGLIVEADDTTIRGLAINRFTYTGLTLNNVNNAVIEGNFIGTDVTGTVDLGNGYYGIHVVGNTTNNVIGGTTARDSQCDFRQ